MRDTRREPESCNKDITYYTTGDPKAGVVYVCKSENTGIRRLRRQRDLLYTTNWGKGGEKEPLIYLWECDGDGEDA